MEPLDTQHVRELFTKVGYDVAVYSDAEIFGAIRRALNETRSPFGTGDVRAAFEALSLLRKPPPGAPQ